jgi:site-specific DNA-methyltransferase (adenine-specific)
MVVRKEIIGNCELYLGDALEVLVSLDRDCADAIVTDPPYCSGAATEANKGSATHQGLRAETIKDQRFKWFPADNMTTSGLTWLMRSLSVESARIVNDGGSMLVFCDWRMSTNLAPAMESAGWRLRNLCIWNKGHFGLGTGFRPQHEMIIHLTKRAPVFHHAGYGNVLDCPRTGAEREHPTAKPIDLMRALVEVVAGPGALVIDPFMGSGTTGVAAVNLGRRFIGVEVDPANFEIACRRIGTATKEPMLMALAEAGSPSAQLDMLDAN